jgi:hypothetical protein
VKAEVGDRLIIAGHRVGRHDRDCEVLEVRGASGAPPYFVRWGDSGQEAPYFPGSDARVEPYAPTEQ